MPPVHADHLQLCICHTPVRWCKVTEICALENGFAKKCAYVFHSTPDSAPAVLTFSRNQLKTGAAILSTPYPCVISTVILLTHGQFRYFSQTRVVRWKKNIIDSTGCQTVVIVVDNLTLLDKQTSHLTAERISTSNLTKLKMNLLPKSRSEFGDTQYWNKFFKQRGKKAFDW